MQAARNWRDEFEEKDARGNEVVYVNRRHGDRGFEYAYLRESDGQLFVTCTGDLIPKPRPKTLRPYRRGEVKCGDVFLGKAEGTEAAITATAKAGVFLGHSTAFFSYDDLCRDFTKLDGSPAGVEE